MSENKDTKFQFLINILNKSRFALMSDQTLRTTYNKREKNNSPIEQELNNELARRFPDYNPKTQTFGNQYAQTPKRIMATAPDTQKIVIDVEAEPKQPDILNSNMIIDTTGPEIHVHVQHLQSAPDGTTYNDIYVNGQKILHNHANTNIKLLCDDTVLAIGGNITNNNNFPARRIWMIYDTNMKSRVPMQRQSFSDYYIHAKGITLTPDFVKLELSNRITVLLETERMKKIAGLRRFKLENER